MTSEECDEQNPSDSRVIQVWQHENSISDQAEELSSCILVLVFLSSCILVLYSRHLYLCLSV